jgi:hypothetical protein
MALASVLPTIQLLAEIERQIPSYNGSPSGALDGSAPYGELLNSGLAS